MSNEWTRVPLDSVARFQEGPGILAKDFVTTGVPLVRLAGLGGHEVTLHKCNYLNPSLVEKKWDHFKLTKGDILISTSASFGRSAVVGEEAEGSVFYTGIVRFRSKSPDLDEGYLKTFLGSRAFMLQAEARASGSVISHFGPSHLRRMEIALPPPEIQQNIAHVHSALDDQIELNRRINETLEGLARAIFKDWFVDFGPTRAKADGRTPYLAPELWDLFPDTLDVKDMPVGWELSEIGKEVEVVGGATPSTKEPSYWEGGENHWATPKDLSKLTSPVLLDTDRKITDAAVDKISSGMVPVGTVLLSSRAPIGYLAIAEVPTAVNQGFIAMVCRKRLPNVFVLLWSYENLDYIKGISGGSTFAEISKKAFRPVSVVVPSEGILTAFESLVRPLYEHIVANTKESESLGQTRDLLLPKLMSGEIRLAERRI